MRAIHKIMVVTHASHERSGPPQFLVSYLAGRIDTVWYVVHPLLGISDFQSYARLYRIGSTARIRSLAKSLGPNLLRLLIHVVSTVIFAIGLKTRFELFIGVDPLNAFSGIILRSIGIAPKVVYFSVDYVPHRFENRLLNSVYHAVDKFCVELSDSVWNASSRIAAIREKQGRHSRNLVVPAGVEFDKIQQIRAGTKQGTNLVFVGYLASTKGAQLVVDAMPDVLKEVPQARLIIVGTGPMESELQRMVAEIGVQNHVKFMKTMSYDQLIKLLCECGIGIATYVPDADSYSRWGDPMKIKEYAACGLPIVMTAVPEIAIEVKRQGAGLIVDYDRGKLARAIVSLLKDDELYAQTRRKALEFASCYDWSLIFSRALEQTFCVENR